MTFTAAESVWLHWLFGDVRVSQYVSTPAYCDDKFLLQIADNLVFHECTKHFFSKTHIISHFQFLLDKLSIISLQVCGGGGGRGVKIIGPLGLSNLPCISPFAYFINSMI